jgi:hypothetical protein
VEVRKLTKTARSVRACGMALEAIHTAQPSGFAIYSKAGAITRRIRRALKICLFESVVIKF